VATARALPWVVDAVDGRGEVYVDGGIRSGVDIVKALALGADAVIAELTDQLARALAYCGARHPANVTRDLLGPHDKRQRQET
jgi:glutamate synthase domain-containing protein 2